VNIVIRNWRAWVLIALFLGPVAAYVGFGILWLDEKPGVFGFRHEWLYLATTIWVAAGIVFSLLASRWTKSPRKLLPPIDWDAPQTFSPFDRQAWALVEEEANRGDLVSMEQLSGFDTYIDTGKRLAARLSAHYHPLSTDPFEDIPVVEVLTALQLAAEDLVDLCRQVPGGDLITPSHWKTAVQAAGYLQRANDIYSYLLPIFQPVTGLARLGSQKLMVQPAWKNMQQNLLRWFYRAFVNRLGTHLIELNSGRLLIGAAQYRRLSRKVHEKTSRPEDATLPLSVVVIGAKETARAALVTAFRHFQTADPADTQRRLREAGTDPAAIGPFLTAEFREGEGYTVHADGETSRDRSSRKAAVGDAVESDLAILLVDASRTDYQAERKFVEAWIAWFDRTPGREAPPIIVVLDTGKPGPVHHTTVSIASNGFGFAERAATARTLELLREAMPLKTVPEIVAADLTTTPPDGLYSRLLPAIVRQARHVDRASILRDLHRMSSRSKARRLISQVGKQGRGMFDNLRHPKGTSTKP
jgi:hypothetical protein